MKKAKVQKRKKTSKPPRPVHPRLIILGAGLIILGAAAGYAVFRPRPVWLVEDRFVKAWEQVLAAGASPLRGAKVIPLSAAPDPLPAAYYGYRIGTGPLSGKNGTGPVVQVYRGLAGPSRFGDALTLALDPWMVFRKFTDPPLTRDRAEDPGGGEGALLFPGSDGEAVRAWVTQLLQETPGIFPPRGEVWEGAGEQIFNGRRFQQGARTYTWEEIWPRLLGEDELAWVYAPLSKIRELPVHETNILEADVFPGRSSRTEFGLQAEILWAIPVGKAPRPKKRQALVLWLQDVRTQSLVADTLGWLAAHRGAPPYNPVSGTARIAWLSSSLVWERESGL